MSRNPPGVNTVSSLTSVLHPHLSSLACPYLSSSLASLPPLLSSHLSSLQAMGEERLPGLATARRQVDTGKIWSNVCTLQVTGGVQYLDSTLCSCLDQLLTKVLYYTPAGYCCFVYTAQVLYPARCPLCRPPPRPCTAAPGRRPCRS